MTAAWFDGELERDGDRVRLHLRRDGVLSLGAAVGDLVLVRNSFELVAAAVAAIGEVALEVRLKASLAADTERVQVRRVVFGHRSSGRPRNARGSRT